MSIGRYDKPRTFASTLKGKLRALADRGAGLWYAARPRGSFTWGGTRLPYFWHPYNTTWKNERAIEVPIVRALLAPYAGKRVLEVGNVLSHYGPVRHDVLDKYERGPRVINEDIVSFVPARPYDAVVAISTLEHIGRDDEPRPEKVFEAFAALQRLLTPGGSLMLTVPVGYHPVLDAALRAQTLPSASVTAFARVSADNTWEERPLADVLTARYGSPYPAANGLVVLTWQAPSR